MILFSLLNLSFAEVTPHNSYSLLPSANGVAVFSYNLDSSSGAVIDRFSDHVYKQYSPEQDDTRDLLYDSYFGIDVDGTRNWLNQSTESGYVEASNIIELNRPHDKISITEYAWAPPNFPQAVFYQMVKISNTDTQPHHIQLYSIHNYHVGDNNTENEVIAWEGLLHEQGINTGLHMFTIPMSPVSSFTCSPDNPFEAFNNGEAFSGNCAGEGDDVVGGLSWDLGVLTSGEERWIGVVHGFAVDESLPASVENQLNGATEEFLFSQVKEYWQHRLEQARLPTNLSEKELALAKQSLVFLLMSQSQENNDSFGQIPASLPTAAAVGTFQHQWNITWVRDSAYAIRALTEAGYIDEAKRALSFLLNAQTGAYEELVGYPHALSICRQYGNGLEWSDTNEHGPNIEFDNFGLFLWALGGIFDETGADEDIQAWWPSSSDGVATVLTSLIDRDVNLLQPDSSIWESHWNGQQKQFAYSSIWASKGLDEAAKIADQLGDERAYTYRDASQKLQLGIETGLVDLNGVLAGSLEELSTGEYLDLAAVEAINTGIIYPHSSTAHASFDAWREHLLVNSHMGYKRNDDGELYDEYEWIVMDLRLAEALRRSCRVEEAQALEDWITEQAHHNYNIIPELFHPELSTYAGPAPMLGFGAGAYLLSILHRAEAADVCAELESPIDSGEPEPAGEPSDVPEDSTENNSSPPKESPTDSGCVTTMAISWMWFPIFIAWKRRE